MNDLLSLEQAERRLNSALDALEQAIHRRVVRDRAHAGLRLEVQALAEDRARLAAELDRSMARATRLADTNREAISRIDNAMTSIRALVTPSQSAGS